jgi:hypothetical protein
VGNWIPAFAGMMEWVGREVYRGYTSVGWGGKALQNDNWHNNGEALTLWYFTHIMKLVIVLIRGV